MKTMRKSHRYTLSNLLCLLSLLMLSEATSQTIETSIGQLVKPGTGDDSKVRLEIRTKTNLSFRPGAESERQAQENLLLAGLTKMTDWEVRAYLMDEIRYAGKLASLPILAPYLNDANLCEPATMALLSIGTTEGAEKIAPFIRPALISSTGKCTVTLMRAAGSLRDGDAGTVEYLLKASSSLDPAIHSMALRGLANIGDIKATSVLAEAIKSANMLDHFQAIDLNLLFAIRLAQKGLKTEATAIANAVKAAGIGATQKNVVIHADSILEIIKTTVVAVVPQSRFKENVARVELRNSMGKFWVVSLKGGPYRVTLRDLRGKLLQSFNGEGEGTKEFSLGTLPVGIYRLNWSGTSGTLSRIILITH